LRDSLQRRGKTGPPVEHVAEVDGQRLSNVRERVAGGKNQDSPVMEHIVTRDSHAWRSFLAWRRIVNKGDGKASPNAFQTKGISGCILIDL